MAATDPGAIRDKHCGGKKRSAEGGNCTRPAGWGTKHVGIGRCKLHGGSAPSSVIAAERVIAAETAERYSVPRDVHPVEGLLEQYHRYAGQVAWLEGRVNDLPEAALFWGVESETDRRDPDGDDGERLRTGAAAEFERKSKAGPNALLEQFDRVQREYAKLGVDIVRIGLETAAASMAGRFAGKLGGLLDALMVDFAAEARRLADLSAADEAALLAALRPLAVERIAAFAGAQSAGGVVAA